MDEDRKPCAACGRFHETKCHLIRAYEYYPSGKLKRIEYVTFVDVPPSPVLVMPEHETKQ